MTPYSKIIFYIGYIWFTFFVLVYLTYNVSRLFTVSFSAEFLGAIFKYAALFENLKTPIAFCLTMLIRFELLFFADLP